MSTTRKPPAVTVGCWVKIKDPDIGEETIYLVDAGREQPRKGRFATNSVFAQALIGARSGQEVSYPLPNGGEETVKVLDFGFES